MRHLYRPSVLQALLQKWQVFPKKTLSQNFLIDQNIIQKILQVAEIQSDDQILEIGPGVGSLTESFLNMGANVIAIEKDKTFANKLKETLKSAKLQVFEEDFLRFPLKKIIKKNMKVVSSPPYNIFAPLLAKLFEYKDYFQSITLCIQNELAQRMLAKKNEKNYSSFSIFTQFYTHCQFAFKVSPCCFYPKPKVTSAVVKLVFKNSPDKINKKAFHLFVQKAFQQKRKKIINSLFPDFAKEDILKALMLRKIPVHARAQNLSLNDYLFLFQELTSSKKSPE